MSAVEYNNLVFKIRQRLDQLNVGEQLLFMCRGKVATRSDENTQDGFSSVSLFVELEEKGFLGRDRLDVLKDLLEGVEEWSLFGNVEKFESKRKEYNNLLEQIIGVLDELNDLERLVSICRGKIAEERQGNIHDVRSLFKELQNNNCLEFDRLDILKEILTQTENSDLLKEVEEFEERRTRERKFEKRKAQAAAIVSSVSNKLAGVLTVKTVFKVAAGGLTVAASLELLMRGSTYDQLIAAVSTCVLPAGAKLIQITEGCVCLTVQAENLSALNTLWGLYKDGTLKARLQALFVTDEMIELAGGEQVEAIVTIEEQEYEKARNELTSEAEGADDGEERLKYLDQEKLSYIQSYLEKSKDIDTQSITTEASDSGMSGSHGAPSVLEMEETRDSTSKLCLKDLSKEMTAELSWRLESDPIAERRFYQSFGLDPDKLYPERLRNISKLFPDTPAKLLKDVFEALQLYDLVELLEKAKPRTLRLAPPLKEMKTLPSADSNRPVTFYSKAEVLIIESDTTSAAQSEIAERIGSFFKDLDSRNEVTTLTETPPSVELLEELNELKMEVMENDLDAEREERLKEFLEKKPVLEEVTIQKRKRSLMSWPSSRKTASVNEKEPWMKKELEELIKRREQWTKERKPKIEKEIKQKEEKLQKDKEKFVLTLSTVMDKWINIAHDKGRESTLFVVFGFADRQYWSDEFDQMIGECLKEKLSLIPDDAKLVITDSFSSWRNSEDIPRETLLVRHLFISQVVTIFLATLLELLNKRWETLDLISVMLELKRTLTLKLFNPRQLVERRVSSWKRDLIQIHDSLSSLPRLQKTKESTG